VQIALCLLVTAGLFFLLGRWSLEVSRPQPAQAAAVDRSAPWLDLNRATRAELRLLPGLGDALAARVVEYRQRHGRFRTVDELRQVVGIGPKTLDRLRPCLFVSTEEQFTADEDSEPIPAGEMPPSTPRTAVVSKKEALLTGPININRATQAELQRLPGIGPKLSQRILDERARAKFQAIEDLRRVPGIGPKTLEKLRPHILLDSPPAVVSH
jgi:competence protein ComEA